MSISAQLHASELWSAFARTARISAQYILLSQSLMDAFNNMSMALFCQETSRFERFRLIPAAAANAVLLIDISPRTFAERSLPGARSTWYFHSPASPPCYQRLRRRCAHTCRLMGWASRASAERRHILSFARRHDILMAMKRKLSMRLLVSGARWYYRIYQYRRLRGHGTQALFIDFTCAVDVSASCHGLRKSSIFHADCLCWPTTMMMIRGFYESYDADTYRHATQWPTVNTVRAATTG